MEIKEFYLKLDEISQLHVIFEHSLKKCPDSQIYIEQSLFDEMYKNGTSHDIQSHNYIGDSHYSYNNQYKFAFHVNRTDSNTILAIAFFVCNCKGYMQLTHFEKKKIFYKNYLVGMNQIILVKKR